MNGNIEGKNNDECNDKDQNYESVTLEKILRRSFLDLPNPKRPRDDVASDDQSNESEAVEVHSSDPFIIDKYGRTDHSALKRYKRQRNNFKKL